MRLAMQELIGEEIGWRRFPVRCLAVSAVLHVVAAIFSVGYHSADEQFQILEFVAYKLGRAPVGVLAVEFPERMRPWLQPGIYYVIVRAAELVGIRSPFTWALLIRLFTGLVGWLSGAGLMLCARFWFRDPGARRFVVLALTLTWFLPALHVRPSSEGLGGAAFFLGLSIATLATELGLARLWPWVAAGVACGVGFEARFQMGIMVAGLFAWLLVRETRTRVPLSRLIAMGAGLALLIGFGRVVDYWGYGEWVLSPARYFSYNLVRGEVSRYGAAPWWDVFRMSFTESFPVLGLLLAIACVAAWIRRPGHLLTWATLPFFLVHEAIAHKELRFFFPIALAAPVLLTLALASAPDGRLADPRGSWRTLWRGILISLGALNLVALAALCLVPFARTVQFYGEVWDELPDPSDARGFELYAVGRDPFEVLGTPIYFYRAPGYETRRPADGWSGVARRLRELPPESSPIYLFSPRLTLPDDAIAAGVGRNCVRVRQTLPTWIERINVGDWVSRANAWSLWKCRGTGR